MRQKSASFPFSSSPLPKAEDGKEYHRYPLKLFKYQDANIASNRRRAFHPTADEFEIRIELIRKSLHLLIAFAPILLLLSRTYTLAALLSGTASYAIFEFLRIRGIQVPVVSWLTARAARIRDDGRFVWGPVTLGLGAFFAILLFNDDEATVAIYALAFGDGFSSLIGKAFGRIPMPLSSGKSLEGSITCLSLTFLSTFLVLHSFVPSLLIALAASFVEMLPLKDLDNIAIPLAVGFVASLLI